MRIRTPYHSLFLKTFEKYIEVYDVKIIKVFQNDPLKNMIEAFFCLGKQSKTVYDCVKEYDCVNAGPIVVEILAPPKIIKLFRSSRHKV